VWVVLSASIPGVEEGQFTTGKERVALNILHLALKRNLQIRYLHGIYT
jgi:hypothetical protein